MRLHTLINIIITSVLIILGSILGGSFSNTLHLFWLSILIVFAVFIQFLYNLIKESTSELKAEKDKVSAFLLRRESTNQSPLQCSMFPKNNGAKILKNQILSIEVYISSVIELGNPLELKLSTNKDCNIKINNQNINITRFAGNYNFYLNNSLRSNLDKKYFKYYFEIEFKDSGEYVFNIEANNGEVLLEVSNSLKVFPS